jgi:hypothetical protein
MPRPSGIEAACQGADWTETPTLRCLGFDLSVRTNDPSLARHVTWLYEACRAAGPARHRFILRRHARPAPGPVTLYRDGRAVLRRRPPGLGLAHLVWQINRGVVDDAGDRLLLHAAAAERDGTVVLIAGPQDAGKSTLVVALVRAGLRYVTDETVSIEPSSTTVEPYPKPITLDRRLSARFPELRPEIDPELEAGLDQWLIPPQAIRAGAVAPSGGVARVLVLVGYRPGARTTVQSIPRADAAVALAAHAFNFGASGSLHIVADVVGGCCCYQLTTGELDAGSRRVLDLLEPALATR